MVGDVCTAGYTAASNVNVTEYFLVCLHMLVNNSLMLPSFLPGPVSELMLLISPLLVEAMYISVQLLQ